MKKNIKGAILIGLIFILQGNLFDNYPKVFAGTNSIDTIDRIVETRKNGAVYRFTDNVQAQAIEGAEAGAKVIGQGVDVIGQGVDALQDKDAAGVAVTLLGTAASLGLAKVLSDQEFDQNLNINLKDLKQKSVIRIVDYVTAVKNTYTQIQKKFTDEESTILADFTKQFEDLKDKLVAAKVTEFNASSVNSKVLLQYKALKDAVAPALRAEYRKRIQAFALCVNELDTIFNKIPLYSSNAQTLALKRLNQLIKAAQEGKIEDGMVVPGLLVRNPLEKKPPVARVELISSDWFVPNAQKIIADSFLIYDPVTSGEQPFQNFWGFLEKKIKDGRDDLHDVKSSSGLFSFFGSGKIYEKEDIQKAYDKAIINFRTTISNHVDHSYNSRMNRINEILTQIAGILDANKLKVIKNLLNRDQSRVFSLSLQDSFNAIIDSFTSKTLRLFTSILTQMNNLLPEKSKTTTTKKNFGTLDTITKKVQSNNDDTFDDV